MKETLEKLELEKQTGIPDDWKQERLGDYSEIFSGYAFKSENFIDDGLLVVKIGNLQDGTIIIDNRTNYYPRERLNEIPRKYFLKEGDILIALTGATTGKISVVPKRYEGALLNQRVGKFNILNKELSSEFLRFFSTTKEFQDSIQGNILKSAQGNISPNKIQQLLILLPPYSEQQRISFVLFKIQQAIEQQDKIIQITKELKKSLMNKLFTEGLHGEEQKETEIGLMPKSWKVISISEVTSGKLKNGAFIHHPKYGKGHLFINVEDIYKNTIASINDLPRIDCQFSEIDDFLLVDNDVLFVRSSLKREGIAYCCLIKEVKEPVFFDCHLIRVRLDTSRINPEYFVYCWLSFRGRQELISKSKTTTMTTINQNNLSIALFPCPNINEQQEIANTLLSVEKKISQAESRKQALQSLFKTMLNQLMTGKIRVKNLDIGVN